MAGQKINALSLETEVAQKVFLSVSLTVKFFYILKGNSGVKMNLFQRNGQLVRVPFALPVLSSGLSSGICFG